MDLYPAIDLKDGKCIRLKKGLLSDVTKYNDNPLDQAKYFKEMGAKWIHIVDIDGAFSGKNTNKQIIFDIKKNVNCSLQVGGGIRSLKTIEIFFNNNIDRLVLGTVALKNQQFLKETCKLFPGKIAVGIDAKKGKVATHGWSKTSNVSFIDFAKRLEDTGVSVVIFTDIDKDGVMEGMNLIQINELISSTNLKIISSGGVSSLTDLEKLKQINSKKLIGVISGRAIYEKKFSVRDAIKLLKDN